MYIIDEINLFVKVKEEIYQFVIIKILLQSKRDDLFCLVRKIIIQKCYNNSEEIVIIIIKFCVFFE